MFIRITHSCAGEGFNYGGGHQLEVGVDIPKDRALMLLNGGLAEPVRDQSTEKVAYPRHVGGGSYELSDGSRVKGKAAALKAEKALGD